MRKHIRKGIYGIKYLSNSHTIITTDGVSTGGVGVVLERVVHTAFLGKDNTDHTEPGYVTALPHREGEPGGRVYVPELPRAGSPLWETPEDATDRAVYGKAEEREARG